MRRLLIRPGAIGDIITSLPAMECLRAARTEVWVPSSVVPLIRFADSVASIASTGLDLLEISGQRTNVLDRLREFDSIISWYGTSRPDFRKAVRKLPFHFFSALPSDMHAVDFYLKQVGELAPCAKRAPSLPVSHGEAGGYTVIHPFSGSPAKNWPLEDFRALAEQLHTPVLWTAGPEEPLEAATRFDSLWDLAEWIAKARCYIGNDSGITHLAAATGVPTIAIFMKTNPGIWAPRGPNVQVLVRPTVPDVMSRVSTF